jgi:hypothetical protein
MGCVFGSRKPGLVLLTTGFPAAYLTAACFYAAPGIFRQILGMIPPLPGSH